jgi:hypothetical protein
MRIRVAYEAAEVWYDDGNKHPTPEHVDDLLNRLERTLDRMWRGKAPEAVDLSEHENES